MLKRIYKLLVCLFLVILLQNCKKDDVIREIILLETYYTQPNQPIVLHLDDAYLDNKTIEITGQEGEFQIIEGRILLFYPKDNQPGDENNIEISVFKSSKLIATGKTKLETISQGECFNGVISKNYVIKSGSSLFVNIMENFCGYPNHNTSEIDLLWGNTDKVLFNFNENGAAEFYYKSPENFVGEIQFIYYLCFNGGIWDKTDPYSACKFYYSALVSIDVIE